MQFRQILLHWWGTNKRNFPWREEEYRNPYRAVIAELMLRRTRAAQVAPIYISFLKNYPDLAAGASAQEDALKKILFPLGLAWRADSIINFLKTAYAQHGNALPATRSLLLALPGIGDYVSAAVECFAGDGRTPLIDVNIVRVLGRIFGADISGEARRRKEIRELAAIAMDPDETADYHYAILDFGAKICLARKPDCPRCPFRAAYACTYYNALDSVSENNL